MVALFDPVLHESLAVELLDAPAGVLGDRLRTLVRTESREVVDRVSVK